MTLPVIVSWFSSACYTTERNKTKNLSQLTHTHITSRISFYYDCFSVALCKPPSPAPPQLLLFRLFFWRHFFHFYLIHYFFWKRFLFFLFCWVFFYDFFSVFLDESKAIIDGSELKSVWWKWRKEYIYIIQTYLSIYQPLSRALHVFVMLVKGET